MPIRKISLPSYRACVLRSLLCSSPFFPLWLFRLHVMRGLYEVAEQENSRNNRAGKDSRPIWVARGSEYGVR
jgi:hypothetical protein